MAGPLRASNGSASWAQRSSEEAREGDAEQRDAALRGSSAARRGAGPGRPPARWRCARWRRKRMGTGGAREVVESEPKHDRAGRAEAPRACSAPTRSTVPTKFSSSSAALAPGAEGCWSRWTAAPAGDDRPRVEVVHERVQMAARRPADDRDEPGFVQRRDIARPSGCLARQLGGRDPPRRPRAAPPATGGGSRFSVGRDLSRPSGLETPLRPWRGTSCGRSRPRSATRPRAPHLAPAARQRSQGAVPRSCATRPPPGMPRRSRGPRRTGWSPRKISNTARLASE